MRHATMTKISDTPATIHFTSGKGKQTYHEIKRAEVTDPYCAIGTFQAPTGQMDKEFDVKMDMIKQWGIPLSTSRHEAHETIIYPKVTYLLNITTLTQE